MGSVGVRCAIRKFMIGGRFFEYYRRVAPTKPYMQGEMISDVGVILEY